MERLRGGKSFMIRLAKLFTNEQFATCERPFNFGGSCDSFELAILSMKK
ncbi:MAG: hypothetical protein ACTS4U_00820 [Candidatus Hodgkinia cicadicola]